MCAPLLEPELLARLGEVERTPEFVIQLLRNARGDRHRMSPHHWDPKVDVHVFQCARRNRRWYVKAYFLGSKAVFISVHPGDRIDR